MDFAAIVRKVLDFFGFGESKKRTGSQVTAAVVSDPYIDAEGDDYLLEGEEHSRAGERKTCLEEADLAFLEESGFSDKRAPQGRKLEGFDAAHQHRKFCSKGDAFSLAEELEGRGYHVKASPVSARGDRYCVTVYSDHSAYPGRADEVDLSDIGLEGVKALDGGAEARTAPSATPAAGRGASVTASGRGSGG